MLLLLALLTCFVVTIVRAQTSKDAYGFIYFTGESFFNGEQIHFAVSQGNSPLNWTQVNSGNPVLTSTLGTKGVRDPFIIRDPNSNKLYIVATDLKMYNSGLSWDQASRKGSLSLSIWDTTDLKAFSPQRLIKVSPDTAGMSWAPEASWDASLGKFVVYWASKIYSASDTTHTGSSYARILYATTSDFVTFSQAQVCIDPGTDIIDTTVTYDATSKTWYRFSKTGGQVIQEKATSLFGTWTTVTKGIGQSQFGDVEGPLVFLSNVYSDVWHVWVDDTSPQGYQPFESSNIAGGTWTLSSGYHLPPNSRHGTVFPISSAEATNLASIKV